MRVDCARKLGLIVFFVAFFREKLPFFAIGRAEKRYGQFTYRFYGEIDAETEVSPKESEDRREESQVRKRGDSSFQPITTRDSSTVFLHCLPRGTFRLREPRPERPRTHFHGR